MSDLKEQKDNPLEESEHTGEKSTAVLEKEKFTLNPDQNESSPVKAANSIDKDETICETSQSSDPLLKPTSTAETLTTESNDEASSTSIQTEGLENTDPASKLNEQNESETSAGNDIVEQKQPEPSGPQSHAESPCIFTDNNSTSNPADLALGSNNENSTINPAEDKSVMNTIHDKSKVNPIVKESNASSLGTESIASPMSEETNVGPLNKESEENPVTEESGVDSTSMKSHSNPVSESTITTESEESNVNIPNKSVINVIENASVPDDQEKAVNTQENASIIKPNTSPRKSFEPPEIVPNSEIHIPNIIQHESPNNEESFPLTNEVRTKDCLTENQCEEHHTLLNEIKEEIIDDDDPLALNESSHFEQSLSSEHRSDSKYIISPSFELNLDSKFKPKIMLEKINVHSGSLIIKEEQDDPDYYDSLNSPNSSSSNLSLIEKNQTPARRRGRPPSRPRGAVALRGRPKRPIKTPSRFLSNSIPLVKTKPSNLNKPNLKSNKTGSTVKVSQNKSAESESKLETNKPSVRPGPASSKTGNRSNVKSTPTQVKPAQVKSAQTKPVITDNKMDNSSKSKQNSTNVTRSVKSTQELTTPVANKDKQAHGNQVAKNIVKNLSADSTPGILKKSKRKASSIGGADPTVQEEPTVVSSSNPSSDQPNSTTSSTLEPVSASASTTTAASAQVKAPPAKKAKVDTSKPQKKKPGRAHRKIFDYESYLREHLEAEANDKKPSSNDINGEPFQLLSSLVGVNIPPSKIKVLPFTNSSNSALRTNLIRKTNENDGKSANSGEKKERTLYDLMQDLSQILPSWNLHVMPDSNTFCIAQVCRGRSGIPTLKTSIELDSNFNAKVFIHQLHCKRYDGVYDSEESISALIQEIDTMSK